jgi:hypothetical protein
MASCGILPPLLTLLAPGVSEEVAGAALRLAHNLSFDAWFRGAMARGGFVPRVSPGVAQLGVWGVWAEFGSTAGTTHTPVEATPR